MKTKLLGLFLSVGSIAWAQSPIESFYPTDNSSYKMVQSAAGIDQSATGANASWNFSDLLQIGTSVDVNQIPDANQSSTYPNTTQVTKNTSTIGQLISDSYMFSKNNNGEISITGLTNPTITMNFSTNNAVVGTFPMNFGDTNSDNLAGNYVYGTYNGTLSGTVNTLVDAYGNLNLNIDGISSTHAITRLKSVQNISLNYSIFPNVGTIVQTIYSYYEAGNSTPIFRSTETIVNVPLQGIVDETTVVLEKFDGILSNNTFDTNQSLAYPNPIRDLLYLSNPSTAKITLSDMRGRMVLSQVNPSQTMDVSGLENGLYLLEIQTEKGTQIQKILKN